MYTWEQSCPSCTSLTGTTHGFAGPPFHWPVRPKPWHHPRSILEGCHLPVGAGTQPGPVHPAGGHPSSTPSQPQLSTTVLCTDPRRQQLPRTGTDTSHSELHPFLCLKNAFIDLYNLYIILLRLLFEWGAEPRAKPRPLRGTGTLSTPYYETAHAIQIFKRKKL